MPPREPRPDVEMVQLATRIPKVLLQRVRVWGHRRRPADHGVVEAAIREALEQEQARARKP